MIAGLTHEQLLHEAIVRPRDARALHLDVRVVERPGWFQILTPSFRQGGLNEVGLACLGDDEADAVIDDTIAQYAAHDLRFRWTITPECRPRDLPERLARRGFLSERIVVMAAAIADLQIPEAPDITVDLVDHTSVERYADLVGRGWSVDPAPLLAYQRAILDDPTDDRNHAFLATINEIPVGGALHAAFARSAFLMGAVVLPEHRSRGVYRALLAARLRHAAARGLGLVTTHARATTSAPILARLGFTALCELPVFFNR